MPEEIAAHLATFALNADCWYASVRPDGRPHIAPIWFVWVDNAAWMMTTPKTVRARNLTTGDLASVASPDTKNPFILEGRSERVAEPPEAVRSAFLEKYEWKLGDDDPEYSFLIRFTPHKALAWSTSGSGMFRWQNIDGHWQENDR